MRRGSALREAIRDTGITLVRVRALRAGGHGRAWFCGGARRRRGVADWARRPTAEPRRPSPRRGRRALLRHWTRGVPLRGTPHVARHRAARRGAAARAHVRAARVGKRAHRPVAAPGRHRRSRGSGPRCRGRRGGAMPDPRRRGRSRLRARVHHRGRATARGWHRARGDFVARRVRARAAHFARGTHSGRRWRGGGRRGCGGVPRRS